MRRSPVRLRSALYTHVGDMGSPGTCQAVLGPVTRSTGYSIWSARHVAKFIFCRSLIPVNITFPCTKYTQCIFSKANNFSFKEKNEQWIQWVNQKTEGKKKSQIKTQLKYRSDVIRNAFLQGLHLETRQSSAQAKIQVSSNDWGVIAEIYVHFIDNLE